MKLGAQDYIVKPFNPDEILIRLKRILDNQKLQELMETGRQDIKIAMMMPEGFQILSHAYYVRK
jgi:DNA-binding response OmpR family regulator